MSELRCEREREVLEELAAGRAIAGINHELQQHIDQCAPCTELVAVAGALLHDRQSLMHAAKLPGSGLVWWRATMRARQEATRAAMRTARAVQVALLTAAFAIGATIVGVHVTAIELKALIASAPYALVTFGVPLLAVATWLILAPVALYFVVSEE